MLNRYFAVYELLKPNGQLTWKVERRTRNVHIRWQRHENHVRNDEHVQQTTIIIHFV